MAVSGIRNKEDLVTIALMSEIPDWGSKTKKESFWGLAAAAAKQLIPFVLVPVALTHLAPAMVIADEARVYGIQQCPIHFGMTKCRDMVQMGQTIFTTYILKWGQLTRAKRARKAVTLG